MEVPGIRAMGLTATRGHGSCITRPAWALLSALHHSRRRPAWPARTPPAGASQACNAAVGDCRNPRSATGHWPSPRCWFSSPPVEEIGLQRRPEPLLHGVATAGTPHRLQDAQVPGGFPKLRRGELRPAIEIRPNPHNSDRGSQCTSTAFQGWCVAFGVRQSMGRTRVLGNTVAESAFSTLKN